MQRRLGFTLIELLVVIAVIAVLMGILMPALHMARMQAQRVVCATRLKDMGHSLYMYAQEFDGRLPPMNEVRPQQTAGHYTRWFRSGDNTWWNLGFMWKAGIITDGKIFYCPSTQVRFKYEDYSDPVFPASSTVDANPGTRVSFMYNPVCVSVTNRSRQFSRLSQLKGSRTLLIADSFLDGNVPHRKGWNVLAGDFSISQVMNSEVANLVETYRSGLMEADYVHFDRIVQLLLGQTVHTQ
ncbi:MAG: type II secretion system GspH family protein [Phycisphaerae bacterium]|nr:type II secretion system GspH family protein [Phycisphaerae bacterium]